jgi:hypothetical protein
MVTSFERSTFKLTEDSASMALEAAIGGYCDNLHVSCIKVSFTVSCKHVGFWILKCHFVLLPAIEMLLSLMVGFGGPNWKNECDQQWTTVSPSKRRVE